MKKIISAVFVLSAMIIAATAYSQKIEKYNANVVKKIIENWPAKPKEVANQMIAKYGAPAVFYIRRKKLRRRRFLFSLY